MWKYFFTFSYFFLKKITRYKIINILEEIENVENLNVLYVFVGE